MKKDLKSVLTDRANYYEPTFYSFLFSLGFSVVFKMMFSTLGTEENFSVFQMFSVIFPILFIFITSLYLNLKLNHQYVVYPSEKEKEEKIEVSTEEKPDMFSIFYEVQDYLIENNVEKEIKEVVNGMILKVKTISPMIDSFSTEMVHELETMIKKDTMNLIYYYCQLDKPQREQSKEKMMNMLHVVNDKLETRFIQTIKNNHHYDFEKTATLMNER